MLTQLEVQQYIDEAEKVNFSFFSSAKEAVRFALQCVDLTTLEGDDTELKVRQLCNKAITYNPSTAAVCVYPVFAKAAKQCLTGTDVKVACVAGAFPAGQSPLELKLAEVDYAVAQGADEIDMVISRGKFLEGKLQEVSEEIMVIRSHCSLQCLKVILETGELLSIENIYNASMIAMQAGADYIKTSTGKIHINATPQAFVVMLHAIKDYYAVTGRMVGVKPAGGIADVDTALLYVKLLERILGEQWLNKQYFRIGTSRLADKLYTYIQEN
ncbi:MAG: deoxyribose-phosphate aldolase [Bacteroidales bacterium]|nr:deoxyribose-phosphate aldolase [Bacteroidales bacterium]